MLPVQLAAKGGFEGIEEALGIAFAEGQRLMDWGHQARYRLGDGLPPLCFGHFVAG